MTAMYVKELAPCRSPFKPNGDMSATRTCPPLGFAIETWFRNVFRQGSRKRIKYFCGTIFRGILTPR